MSCCRILRTCILLAALSACAPPVNGQPVRSSLYPPNWTPGHTDAEGRFLHDFSHAGYRRAEYPLPQREELPIFNVTEDYGADNSGTSDATISIQSAIHDAELTGGGIVYLPEGVYRCHGQLMVSASNVILRGDGPELSKVYFTQDSLDFSGNIVFQGNISREAEIALTADTPTRATTLSVLDAGDLEVGDDISIGWIISEAFVAQHGMTGTWTQFNGQWKPFFRREVIAINRTVSPHEITIDIPTRYPALLRDAASIRRESGYLAGCAVEDIAFSNAIDYDAAWQRNQVHVLQFKGTKDSYVRNLASFPSPLTGASGYHVQSGGIMVADSKRITVADTVIEKAQNRGGGGNGYLFEVRQSGEVLFRDCIARAGRHNFIQNWDFGATGIVWLRCLSEGSQAVTRAGTLEFPLRAYSEYHHSLATANLVDSCQLADGWAGGNRGSESSGAGHSAAQCVYWNVDGLSTGRLRSFSHGHGYVIGTRDITVYTVNDITFGNLNLGTDPVDFTEHVGNAGNLQPQSLYESQLARRLGINSEGEPEGVADGEGQPEAEVLPRHAADWDGNGRITLNELLRLVQLYHAESFSCAALEAESTEDGYRPGGDGPTGCAPHTADYAPQDWRLNLSELLRSIQLYGMGTLRPCAESEDGFCSEIV